MGGGREAQPQSSVVTTVSLTVERLSWRRGGWLAQHSGEESLPSASWGSLLGGWSWDWGSAQCPSCPICLVKSQSSCPREAAPQLEILGLFGRRSFGICSWWISSLWARIPAHHHS